MSGVDVVDAVSVGVSGGGGPAVLVPNDGRRRSIDERFEREVMSRRKPLFVRAVRLTGNRQDAEDLVQDTILRAYAGFAGFCEGTNVMAWLYQIMRNIWINLWRKKQRRVQETLVAGVTDSRFAMLTAACADGADCPEAAVLEAEVDTDVRAALMSLREVFRIAVYYADVEGFSAKEIATMTNAPVGTVMSRLHRGRRQLRGSLQSVARSRGYSLSEAGASS